MASLSDWAWLPKDLLYDILEKLILLSDHVRFAKVCKPWRSVALDSIIHPPNHLPLLLIPTKDNSPERRSLYSLTANKIFKFQLPVPYNRRLCGSSHGWLAMVDKFTVITLLNPVTGHTLSFPPLDSDFYEEGDDDDENYEYEIYTKKVILKDEPSLNSNGGYDYEVIAIYGPYRSLAIIRTGDEGWTYIDNNRVVISDAIYFKGQVYATSQQVKLMSVDVSSIGSYSDANSQPQAKIVIPTIWGWPYPATTYLVESTAGELLLVQRWMVEKDDNLQWVTSKFKVFKLVYLGSTPEWSETKSLGVDAHFFGDNYSISISATNLPGCEPDCIYYTDDSIEMGRRKFPFGPRDIGVFNLQDKSIRPHWTLPPSQKHMPTPVWFVPTSRRSWF